MRLAIIALFLTFNASAWAQTAFVITPDEIQLQCTMRGYLNVIMTKLQLYTKSKVIQTESYITDEVVCEIVKDYFLNQSLIEVLVQTEVFEQHRTVKDLPCDGYLCRTIFQKTLHERVQLQMNKVRFNVYGEIPNSEKLETIEWDRRYCKPYDMNCEF